MSASGPSQRRTAKQLENDDERYLTFTFSALRSQVTMQVETSKHSEEQKLKDLRALVGTRVGLKIEAFEKKVEEYKKELAQKTDEISREIFTEFRTDDERSLSSLGYRGVRLEIMESVSIELSRLSIERLKDRRRELEEEDRTKIAAMRLTHPTRDYYQKSLDQMLQKIIAENESNRQKLRLRAKLSISEFGKALSADCEKECSELLAEDHTAEAEEAVLAERDDQREKGRIRQSQYLHDMWIKDYDKQCEELLHLPNCPKIFRMIDGEAEEPAIIRPVETVPEETKHSE